MSSLIPQTLKQETIWSRHKNKRPDFSPNISKGNTGLSYEDVEHYNKHNFWLDKYNSGIGVLVSDYQAYIIIDIDAPLTKMEKEAEIQRLRQHRAEMYSQEHRLAVKRTISTIKETFIEQLVTRTYTELSPSGLGLRVVFAFESVEAKRQFMAKHGIRGNKKFHADSGIHGQVDFNNSFITITGQKLKSSPSDIAKMSEEDELKLAELLYGKSVDDPAGPNDEDPNEDADTYERENKSNEATWDRNDEEDYEQEPPSIKELTEALNKLTLDQRYLVKRAWEKTTGQVYEHYTFWLSVGMALHKWGVEMSKTPSAYLLFYNWSAKDPTSFEGEEDVRAKWQSFSSNQNDQPNSRITYRTIMKMQHLAEFDYPKQTIRNGKKTGFPQVNEWVNMEYLLNMYDLQLWEDGGLFLTGDEKVIAEHFDMHNSRAFLGKFYGPYSIRQLEAGILTLAQASKWVGVKSMSQLVNVWVSRRRKEIDLIKEWWDTHFDELPRDMQVSPETNELYSAYDANSTFSTLLDCMNIQAATSKAKRLAETLVYKTFMQVVKLHEHEQLKNTPFDGNGGILILVGPENTYKTTFFSLWLPHALRHTVHEMALTINSEKGQRDFARSITQHFMVQLDEFDGMIDQGENGSWFKNILTKNSVAFTDIYEKTLTYGRRKAVIVGTTNKKQHVISADGSRRMWFINVGKIDTERLLKFNWHAFYNSMRKAFRREIAHGKLPWLLTQAEIDELNVCNNAMAAKTTLEWLLEEIWPTNGQLMPDEYLNDVKSGNKMDKSGKLLKTKHVIQQIKLHPSSNGIKINGPALEHALKRHCGLWTGSNGRTEFVQHLAGYLHDGQLLVNMRKDGNYNHKWWVMPPMQDD